MVSHAVPLPADRDASRESVWSDHTTQMYSNQPEEISLYYIDEAGVWVNGTEGAVPFIWKVGQSMRG